MELEIALCAGAETSRRIGRIPSQIRLPCNTPRSSAPCAREPDFAHNASARQCGGASTLTSYLQSSEFEVRMANAVLHHLYDLEAVGWQEASRSSFKYAQKSMGKAKRFSSIGKTWEARENRQLAFELLSFALRKAQQPGLLLEFGVFQGESINYLAGQTEKTVYGFDSFKGLPEDWDMICEKGTFDIHGTLPAVCENVQLIKGTFQETLENFLLSHDDNVSFIHIDCDIYSSAKYVLEKLAPRLRKGAVIVFDEYFRYPGWEDGEFKAFQEIVNRYDLKYTYLGYSTMWYSVAVMII